MIKIFIFLLIVSILVGMLLGLTFLGLFSFIGFTLVGSGFLIGSYISGKIDDSQYTMLRTLFFVCFVILLFGLFFGVWYPLIPKEKDGLYLILFWSGLIASMLAFLLADDANMRLKNSSFGAITVGVIGVFITLIGKQGGETNDTSLILLCSLLGSLIGSLLGWLVYASLTYIAFIKYNDTMPFLALISNGLKGVIDDIAQKENRRILKDLDFWWRRFSRDLDNQVATLKKVMKDESALTAEVKRLLIDTTIESALASVCEVHNFVYSTSQIRASLIKFTETVTTPPVLEGRHWINYSGLSLPFQDTVFAQNSNAGELLKEPIGTHKFIDTKLSVGQVRDSDDRYRFFSIWKIDEKTVLTLDWPNEENKNIRNITQQYFSKSIIPEFRVLLDQRPTDQVEDEQSISQSDENSSS
ncbi:hypothetical protein GCM10027299_39590 [Larkinella ripae]